jgi:hypothetical protein
LAAIIIAGVLGYFTYGYKQREVKRVAEVVEEEVVKTPQFLQEFSSLKYEEENTIGGLMTNYDTSVYDSGNNSIILNNATEISPIKLKNNGQSIVIVNGVIKKPNNFSVDEVVVWEDLISEERLLQIINDKVQSVGVCGSCTSDNRLDCFTTYAIVNSLDIRRYTERNNVDLPTVDRYGSMYSVQYISNLITSEPVLQCLREGGEKCIEKREGVLTLKLDVTHNYSIEEEEGSIDQSKCKAINGGSHETVENDIPDDLVIFDGTDILDSRYIVRQ